MTLPPPLLSVVIPARDEAEALPSLVAEVQSALTIGEPFEIIVVDDGSTDDTPAVLARLAESSPRLGMVRHLHPRGQSCAIATGVAAAKGDWIVTLDGDGQNDPADMTKLLALRDAAHRRVIVGHRRRRRDGWAKRWASRVANAVRARLLGDRTPDTGCGLKVFPREAFRSLPAFDHMHRFLPALFLRAGLEVISTEVSHRSRRHGRSKYGNLDRLAVGIADLLGVLWLNRRPLRIESTPNERRNS